jgi:hypothetical protein
MASRNGKRRLGAQADRAADLAGEGVEPGGSAFEDGDDGRVRD